jgi:predicted amidohydrolase YtcJ
MTPWGNINLEWLEGSGWENGSEYAKTINGRDFALFLVNASGHLAYANSVAINRFKSDPHASNLMGSALKTGILTELQVSSAMRFVGTCTSTQQKLPQGIADVLQNAAERGVTTLFDPSMGVNDKEIELEALRQVAHLGPLRLAGGLFVHTQDDLSYWLENHKPDLDNHLDQRFSIKGIKIISDGSNQGLTGLQRKPYLCAADHPVPNVPANGKYNYKPKSDLESLVLRALCQGWPTLVHANGDKAIKRVLNAYGKALNPFPHEASSEPAKRRRALRSRLEHASLLDDEDIRRMASMGLSPSFLIGHVGYWGYVFQEKIFGESKARLLDRCQSALNAGMRVSLHSDHFVTPLGPLRMAEQAIYRKMEAAPGSEKPALNAEEGLTHEQALRAVTLDAAWHCHLDHLVGSLEAGKLADLVILDSDPLNPSKEELRDIVVHETWLAGARSYANPATH